MSITRKINAVKCMQYMVKTESAHIVKDQDFYQVSKAVKGTELDRQKASSVIETTIRKWSSEVDLEITGDFGDRKTTVTYGTVFLSAPESKTEGTRQEHRWEQRQNTGDHENQQPQTQNSSNIINFNDLEGDTHYAKRNPYGNIKDIMEKRFCICRS